LFYRVTLDITWLLLGTLNGNRYILVAIDHYSKWVEGNTVVKHEAQIVAKFLEDEIICRFVVLRYILIDNGGEWVAEFDQLCKNYGTTHQHMGIQWPKCNDMAERLVKTFKHGLIILTVIIEHAQDWDEHMPRILFHYRCGI
jgi:hypothetical protein